jgi:predicted DNA binding CopG/RHH family protein
MKKSPPLLKKTVTTFDPFAQPMVFFDAEEKEMYESMERGEWQISPTRTKDIERLRAAAKYTLAKSKSISIRLTPTDYKHIRVKAIEQGIPYQTLIGSLIHRYIHSGTNT